MSAVSAELDLRVVRPERDIPDSDLGKLRCEADAIRYCCENSGLQDKTIAIEIGTDPGTLSKAKAGQARLSDVQLVKLEQLTGYCAVMFAALLMRGYDPRSAHKLESEVERENRLLRAKVERMEYEREVERRTVRDLMRGVAA